MPPVVRIARRKPTRGNLFAPFISVILKAQPKLSAKIMRSVRCALRVCPTEKLCQRGCTRSGIDKPIDIARLQRFITDFEQQTAMKIYQPATKTLGKVAIIGAGPAGLQASVTLSNLGYDSNHLRKTGSSQAAGCAMASQSFVCRIRFWIMKLPVSLKWA
jgi:hypothetical protein